MFKILQRKDIEKKGLLNRMCHLETHTWHTDIIIRNNRLIITCHMFRYLDETCFNANT